MLRYEVSRRYQVSFLKSLVWRNLGLNPGLPDHWQTLYPLGQCRVCAKKSQGNTIVHRFLHSTWFHTQRKDEANTTSMSCPQRNCYSYNDSLQKQKQRFAHPMVTLGSLILSLESCVGYLKKILPSYHFFKSCPVGWSCRIHQLLLN